VQRRGIPALLLNGRMSERSCRRWSHVPGTAQWLLGSFETIYVQTAADGERFRALGAADVRCIGNLKQAAPPLPVDTKALADMRSVLGTRPCWLMASTHPGDEAIITLIQRAVAARFPGTLGLVVPRHPERGMAVAEALIRDGFKVARRSIGDVIAANTEIYIADTLGELGLWYRLSPLAAMGGSLIPHGGQNPMEPARLGIAVVFGPHMFNFAELSADLVTRGAALQVPDAQGMASALSDLLGDSAHMTAMGKAGEAYANERNAVLTDMEEAVLHRLTKLDRGNEP